MEWLFSGVGVFAISVFYALLKNKKTNEIYTKPNKIQTNNRQKNTSIELTEVEKVALRFQSILSLMNEGRHRSQYTIAQLAQLMKLHKISELENVFTGKNEPSFSFIEDFCNTFGVNQNWITEEKGTPYQNDLPTYSDPMDYLSLIEQIKPERIYFVRENSDIAPAFILLKESKWKFTILSRTWHISHVVGAGGTRQLYSFYKLVKELRDKKGMQNICCGLTLEPSQFASLLGGETFPGKYTEIGFTEDPWWDDLTDINHKYPIALNYENWHGKSFIYAQKIIKSYMNQYKSKESG